MTEWTKADSIAALSEGWDIFSCHGSENGFYQICVLEEPNLDPSLGYDEKKFENDCEVWVYVMGMYQEKSPLHMRAMNFIAENNPNEFTCITRWVEKND